jgi:hypothetical protein
VPGHLGDLTEVVQQEGEGLGIPQDVGRMIDRDDPHTVLLKPLAPPLLNARPTQDHRHGRIAHRNQESRPEDLDLTPEIRETGTHFRGPGGPILRGPTLDDVSDVNPAAVDADHPERLGQQLAGGTDEGLALDVFLRPGTLSDEQEGAPRVSYSQDGLPAIWMQGTQTTPLDGRLELPELLFPLASRLR